MRSVLAAIATAVLVSTSAAADIPKAAKAFASVCPAALLAPAQLPDALKAAGLTKSMGMPFASIRADGYSTEDDTISVSITTHWYTDATHASCIVAYVEPSSFAGMRDLRTALEANALIGPLEGSIFPAPSGLVFSDLKRPGNNPLVSASLNSTPTTTTLILELWDFKPKS